MQYSGVITTTKGNKGIMNININVTVHSTTKENTEDKKNTTLDILSRYTLIGKNIVLALFVLVFTVLLILGKVDAETVSALADLVGLI